MKITCHSCGAKYTVSDEKVQGKTVKMKCRKCGATIVVGGASHGDAAAGAEDAGMHAQDGAADAPPPGSFLVSVADNDQRTMTLAEVVEAYNSGVITAETYVFADGMSDWQALGENEQIVSALNEAAQASASLTASAAPAASPLGPSMGYGQPAPSPSQPMAAAMAPSPTDNKPTAARRDTGRKSGDLFGGGGYGGEPAPASYSSGNALAASSSVANTTGKRDENSVLFSLNALTAAAPPIQARPSQTTATKEDSGLIDLKALSANAPPAPAQAQAAAPVIDTVGLFPLGAPVHAPPSATQAYTGPIIKEEKKGSKIGLVIGGIVAIGAVVGVFMIVKGGDDTKTANTSQPTAAQTQAATAAPTPVVTTPAVATADASSEDAASASASTSALAQKPNQRYTGRPPPGGKPPPGGATTTTTAKPPPVSGGGGCGCKPGDVDCMIKCSVKKK